MNGEVACYALLPFFVKFNAIQNSYIVDDSMIG